MDAFPGRPLQPPGHLLAVGSRPVKVVVAGRGQHHGLLAQDREVLLEHDHLRLERDRVHDVRQVADEGDHVDVVGRLDQPVVVRQPVVQIRQGR